MWDVDVPNSQGAAERLHWPLLSPPSPLLPLLPRVRVRCPRLRSALTFSPGTIPRPGRTFYGERLAGKGSDGGIGAVGEVTAKLVSGNRHHAYSLNSAAFGIIVIPSLAEGSSLPYKSLHTSLDPARRRLITIYGCPNAHLWSIWGVCGREVGEAWLGGFIRLVCTAVPVNLWRRFNILSARRKFHRMGSWDTQQGSS